MPESTEALKTAIQGAREVLIETETLAGRLGGHATDLAEETDGHGWYGMATRMQEVAEVLEAIKAEIAAGRIGCET